MPLEKNAEYLQTNGFDPNLHKYTKNQPEVFGVVNRWRRVLDEYDGEK